MASPDFERLAFEASLRALDKQEHVVDELRARTGTLLAASSLSAAFLGHDAFRSPGPVWLAAIAVLAFVVSTAISIYLLTPKRGLVFGESGSVLYSSLYGVRHDMPEVYRQLSYALDGLWDRNDRRILRLSRAYALAGIALVVETFALAAILSGKLSDYAS